MNFLETAIPGVIIVEPNVFGDARGFFMETYSLAAFRAAGIADEFVQDNHSRSSRGVLRGLHYQEPRPQGKLVRCGRGRLFDVAADVRRGSPTFGRWVGVELTEDNRRMLWVPPGFAHGFCALEDNTELLYKCTALYDPASERGVAWNDPDLAVDWPIEADPILSPKDAAAPRLRDAILPEYQPRSVEPTM